jgi:coenzyme F420 hydrogenase subunit beta
MKISVNSSVKEIPLNTLYDKAIRNACFACSDYTASFADISIGNVGSEGDWKTIIIRTDRGKQIFDLAISNGILEEKTLEQDNQDLVIDLTRSKTDIVTIENVKEHSLELKSFYVRNS